eukprot:gb/GECG01009717.1/.p1 GENE.gb/GECG01009717.1/~~gb/GECG01009717.1/.p1  ORF type:complete len:398 (+),score=97.76 gb/GECG01009717.1/:1-1194(+)
MSDVEGELDFSNGCGWESHGYPERRYSMTSDSGATFTGDLNELLDYPEGRNSDGGDTFVDDEEEEGGNQGEYGGYSNLQEEKENDENAEEKTNGELEKTPLKSCLSTQRHSRKPNKVMFGPPKAAEFNKADPASRMTPIHGYKSKDNEWSEEDSDSSESEDTANNSRILAQWGEEEEQNKQKNGSSSRKKKEQKQPRESSIGPMDLQTLLQEEYVDTEVSFKGTPTHKMSKNMIEKLSDARSADTSNDDDNTTRTLENLQQLLQECNDDDDDYSTESEKTPEKNTGVTSEAHIKNTVQEDSAQQSTEGTQQETPQETNGTPRKESPQQLSDGEETDDELQTFRQQEDQLLMSFNITPSKRSRSSSRKRSRQSATSTSKKYDASEGECQEKKVFSNLL